jgi:pimeloyl-ACP methyl ester carboxylesterase
MSESEPLVIARQGYVFAGGHYATVAGKRVLNGQLYAEFQIPQMRRSPYPVIMVHGGSQSGTNFTGTPDGREGWAQHFLRRGYAVYVVDQVGRGRAAYRADFHGPVRDPEVGAAQQRFIALKRQRLWPQAELHTQWPGGDEPGDPVFDQFFASQLPTIADFTRQQELNRDALVALIDKIGPSILLTHSQSGAFGWPVADARPDAVKALLQVEPSGPPFYEIGLEHVGPPEFYRAGNLARPWGLTAVPLTFDPPASSPEALSPVRQEAPDGPGLARGWLQREPARRLPHLMKMPIVIVTAEASYHAVYDHLTVKFLEQAGVHPTFVQLKDRGIRGNGHMLMLEKNNAEIAKVMLDWLDQKLASKAG